MYITLFWLFLNESMRLKMHVGMYKILFLILFLIFAINKKTWNANVEIIVWDSKWEYSNDNVGMKLYVRLYFHLDLFEDGWLNAKIL